MSTSHSPIHEEGQMTPIHNEKKEDDKFTPTNFCVGDCKSVDAYTVAMDEIEKALPPQQPSALEGGSFLFHFILAITFTVLFSVSLVGSRRPTQSNRIATAVRSALFSEAASGAKSYADVIKYTTDTICPILMPVFFGKQTWRLTAGGKVNDAVSTSLSGVMGLKAL